MNVLSGVLWTLCGVLVSLRVCTARVDLEKFEWNPKTPLTCGEDLSDCSVTDGEQSMFGSDPIKAESLKLKALLCCQRGRDCRACLEIHIGFSVTGPCGYNDGSGDLGSSHVSSAENERRSGSGDHAFSYGVCYTAASTLTVCKVLEFSLPSVPLDDHDKPKVWLSLVVSDKLEFGSHVFVSAQSVSESIVIPSVQTVCSTDLRDAVEECDVPQLHTVIDKVGGVAMLKAVNRSSGSLSVHVCLKYEDFGDCKWIEMGQNGNISIPLHAVVPCLCFQARWVKLYALHVKACPFSNYTEFFNNIWRNVSVSVVPAQTNRDETALSWNLSAPCRVDAELWLCKMTLEGALQVCEEMQGSKIRLQKDEDSGWSVSPQGHLRKGEFRNIVAHPTVCVLANVYGLRTDLGPWCPFAAPRSHWRPPLFLLLLLICLAMLAICLVPRSLKGLRRGGHVVLLSPPDSDDALLGLVSGLGSMLSAAGFSVSGDLWRRAEVCAVGPLPWLHAQLERLQCGSKVVLIVTGAALERAEEWQASVENRGPHCGPYSDVFTAALGCILADRVQGCADRRFVLVHFECLPFLPAESRQALPGVFQGLSLYRLPTQTSNFLTELVGAQKGACAWAVRPQVSLWKRILGLCGHRGSVACPLNRLSKDTFGPGSQRESEPLHYCP